MSRTAKTADKALSPRLQKWLDGEIETDDLSQQEQTPVHFRIKDGQLEATNGATTSLEQAKAMVGACQEMSFGQIAELIQTINAYDGQAQAAAA